MAAMLEVFIRALLVCVPIAVLIQPLSASSEPRSWFVPAPIPADVPAAPINKTACRYQAPQPFLIMSNYVRLGKIPDDADPTGSLSGVGFHFHHRVLRGEDAAVLSLH